MSDLSKEFEEKLKLINNRIGEEICQKTLDSLEDTKLLDTYKECNSVKKSINKLKKILRKHKVSEKQEEDILDDYIINLIPAGTKGVIRGNKFNHLVKNIILEMKLDKKIFDIQFETKHKDYDTSEIPDWYIYNKKSDKIIIGMNQLDLWSGGQQTNRGAKYLLDNPLNTEKSKLLSVVCKKIVLKNEKAKAFKFFEAGFSKDILCYPKGLPKIIKSYFNLNVDSKEKV